MLLPVSKCWQPADLLPPSEDPDFLDKVCFKLQCTHKRVPTCPL